MINFKSSVTKKSDIMDRHQITYCSSYFTEQPGVLSNFVLLPPGLRVFNIKRCLISPMPSYFCIYKNYKLLNNFNMEDGICIYDQSLP